MEETADGGEAGAGGEDEEGGFGWEGEQGGRGGGEEAVAQGGGGWVREEDVAEAAVREGFDEEVEVGLAGGWGSVSGDLGVRGGMVGEGGGGGVGAGVEMGEGETDGFGEGSFGWEDA